VPGKNASSGSISRLGSQFPDRRSRIARPGLMNLTPRAPNARNSNRECLRLESAVTQRKQTLPLSSNRELEAYFSALRKGQKTFRGDPSPANPPNFRRLTDEQKSNRERFRLETAVTHRKQRSGVRSNREIGACFSAPDLGPRRDSRAGTPTSGVAGASVASQSQRRLTKAPLRRQRGKRGRRKTKSRPPTFVAIRKNYVIGFIRLREAF
jgi:hypothetical protein